VKSIIFTGRRHKSVFGRKARNDGITNETGEPITLILEQGIKGVMIVDFIDNKCQLREV